MALRHRAKTDAVASAGAPAAGRAPADGAAPSAAAAAPSPRAPSVVRRGCFCCFRLMKCLTFTLVLLYIAFAAKSAIMDQMSIAAALRQPYAAFNFSMMRLFRDISRIKARRRRFAQKDAIMKVLLSNDAPLPLADVDGEGRVALTVEELAEYDGRQLPGSDERAPLYLAILGRIYDVSGGKAFYGPGRTYHPLTGKDASRAFCTGCLEPECLISSLKGLTESQRREADKWVELYEHHDKYKLVGRLRAGIPEATDETAATELLDGMTEEEWEMTQVMRAKEVEGIKKRKIFRPK